MLTIEGFVTTKLYFCCSCFSKTVKETKSSSLLLLDEYLDMHFLLSGFIASVLCDELLVLKSLISLTSIDTFLFVPPKCL